MENENNTTRAAAPVSGELPVLPYTNYNGYSDGSEPLYTAEQMHDYARAAVAAAKVPTDEPQRPMAEVAADFIFFLRKQPNGESWPVGTKLYAAPVEQGQGAGAAPVGVALVADGESVLQRRVAYLEKLVAIYGPKSLQYDVEHPNDGLNSADPAEVLRTHHMIADAAPTESAAAPADLIAKLPRYATTPNPNGGARMLPFSSGDWLRREDVIALLATPAPATQEEGKNA